MHFFLVFAHVQPTESLEALPSLARLAAYGRREAIGDADDAIAASMGAAGHATAPLAALGAGMDVGDAYVLRADPVTLVAGRDDVLLAGRVDDLAPDEASSIVSTLNRHFAGDGVVFHVPRADAWFVTAREHVPVEADAARANEPIGARLPRGPHAATWRRWLSEMQMLLHEHPVNQAREGAGLPPVTGIWISHGGTLPATLSGTAMSIHAAASHAADVALGIARLRKLPVHPVPRGFDTLSRDADAIAIAAPAGDLAALDEAWLSPALRALERGELARMTVVAAGAQVLRYESSRPSWWQRARKRK